MISDRKTLVKLYLENMQACSIKSNFLPDYLPYLINQGSSSLELPWNKLGGHPLLTDCYSNYCFYKLRVSKETFETGITGRCFHSEC